MCNLCSFQTDLLSVVCVNFDHVEVRKYVIFVVRTMKTTYYVGSKYIQKHHAYSFFGEDFQLYMFNISKLYCQRQYSLEMQKCSFSKTINYAYMIPNSDFETQLI